jgi:Flp pilus assembly protein TadG
VTALARLLRRFGGAEDGVAAVEMSLIGVVFAAAMINAVEIGRYGLTLMQLNNAAQAGIAAAYRTCDAAHLPATENCPDLATAVATALHSTTLGDDVTVQGQVTEGWYCVNGAKTLQYMADPSSRPADCSAASNATGSPGLYVSVQAQYTYEPIFPGTFAQTFNPQLTRTAMARFQ